VSRVYRVNVRSITLFLFGGISNIERDPPSPGAELFMALAGPLTSLVLGAVFVALTAAVTSVPIEDAVSAQRAVAQLGPVATLLAWLGPINLIIGVFNLIPAFPLDGGRVLRSILWGFTGDLRRSTLWVSIVGQLFGWALILMGFAMVFGAHIPFFGVGLVGGLWLAFIGWFLRAAAATSYRRFAVDDALAGHTVAELMRLQGLSVAPDLPVASLVHRYLVHPESRALPVVEGGRLVGLVTLTDVGRVQHDRWQATPVRDVMRSAESLVVAWPEEPLGRAFEQLSRSDIRQLPVLDHGRLVGMLLRSDLHRWLDVAWQPHGVRPRTS
jgi:Zn-dependent protease/CBS domain-containing protein